jgi:hypothetical protein
MIVDYCQAAGIGVSNDRRTANSGASLGRRPMKILKLIATIACGLAVVLGIVWILQGYNILPGSFMTGNMQWAYRGMGLAAIGVILLAVINRRRA